MTMVSAPAIHLEGVVKTFPNPLDAARPIHAVDGISLKAGGAEASDRLIALVGPDGAGKSTLMSVLFGMYQPEKGEIRKNGQVVHIKDPNDANALGIGMVHQLSLIHI